MEAMADPRALLRRAQTYLASRDFSSSQKLAEQAMQTASHPSLAADAERILIVAGILLAGDRRDLYAVLRITRADSENSQLLWSRYVELAETLAKPELNVVAFAQEAYVVAFQAFSVLSEPETKSQYDSERENDASSSSPSSFWTVCPYCFWLFQYGEEYEDFCLRCQNCSRAFHGVAIGDPPAEIVVPGKDRYFVCHGVFPLGYRVKEEGKEVNNGGSESCTEKSRGVGGGGNWGKRVAKSPARRMKNVKLAALKKKKMTVSVCELEESQSEEEEEINGGYDLVCFEEHNGDLFVGLEDLYTPT